VIVRKLINNVKIILEMTASLVTNSVKLINDTNTPTAVIYFGDIYFVEHKFNYNVANNLN